MFITNAKQIPPNTRTGEDIPPNRFVTMRDGLVYLAQNKNEVWTVSNGYTLKGDIARVADESGWYKVLTQSTKLPP